MGAKRIRKVRFIGKQNNKSNNLYPAVRNELTGPVYGYINERGNFVIEPKFQNAYDFNEFDIAIVNVNNKAGIIDKNGEYVVHPIYDSISPYKEGRAVYILNNTMGVLDEEGNRITKKPYTFVSNYNEGRAIVGINDEESGSYIYGYIDLQGNEVVSPSYIQANDYIDGVALVKSKDNTFALLDKDGEIINTYEYFYVGQYGEGLMTFAQDSDSPLGYINTQGEVIIKQKFSSATAFRDGVAVVSTGQLFNSKYGVIDKTGKYVYEPIFSRIEQLGEGRVALGLPLDDDVPYWTSIYAIGDFSGNKLSNFKYLSVDNYKEGLASASDNKYTFFIDKNGNIVTNLPIVEGSGNLECIHDLIRANIDYITYYIKPSGKVVYKPNETIKLNNKYSITKLKFKPNYNYLVYFPKVDGLSNKNVENNINEKLREMSCFIPNMEAGSIVDLEITEDDVLEYNYNGDFQIEYFNKNLLVLDMTGYYYPFGAAHGMPYKRTPNINLETGEFYRLSDLFMGGVNWTGELNKIIENMIITDPQYDILFEGAFKGIEENQDFYVDQNNLYIYFPPYEIAPYVAGFVTFKIPFTEIEGIINKEGSFYKSFN
ncbi:MAG: DUF3298 domain-containing protein [Clostridiales bacterium]|nr:DUF3298 domain-containing protein [Clostridiales bacterium]